MLYIGNFYNLIYSFLCFSQNQLEIISKTKIKILFLAERERDHCTPKIR